MKLKALLLVGSVLLLVLSSVVLPASALAGDEKSAEGPAAETQTGGVFFGSSVGGGLFAGARIVGDDEAALIALQPLLTLPGFLLRIRSKQGYRHEFEVPVGDVIRAVAEGAPAFEWTTRWLGESNISATGRFLAGFAFTQGFAGALAGPRVNIYRMGPVVAVEGTLGPEKAGQMGFLLQPQLHISYFTQILPGLTTSTTVDLGFYFLASFRVVGLAIDFSGGSGGGSKMKTRSVRESRRRRSLPGSGIGPDRDKDGIPNRIDACPEEPEDKDDFEDEDGCPDRDNDKDGVGDDQDECPLQAEDRDTWQDGDGCPDIDNDSDGLLDIDDPCPLDAEDKDGFEDRDGCPDLDNDGDGILDVDDSCPGAMETYNRYLDSDGCPDQLPEGQ